MEAGTPHHLYTGINFRIPNPSQLALGRIQREMETGSAYLAQEAFELLPLEEIEKELAEDQLNSRGGCLITMPCMPVTQPQWFLSINTVVSRLSNSS